MTISIFLFFVLIHYDNFHSISPTIQPYAKRLQEDNPSTRPLYLLLMAIPRLTPRPFRETTDLFRPQIIRGFSCFY